jgi:hypothetical protein
MAARDPGTQGNPLMVPPCAYRDHARLVGANGRRVIWHFAKSDRAGQAILRDLGGRWRRQLRPLLPPQFG